MIPVQQHIERIDCLPEGGLKADDPNGLPLFLKESRKVVRVKVRQNTNCEGPNVFLLAYGT